MTPINHYQWPVPLPTGMTFEQIRWEAIRAGATYCWLDVLCLRQKTMRILGNGELCEINAKKRRDEWSIDVPTIGNIYRQARHVLRYFNGLGRHFRLSGWDDSRHWINRAWTLQETRPEHVMVNGGVSAGMHLPLGAKVTIEKTGGQLQCKPLREVLSQLNRMVSDAEGEYRGSVNLSLGWFRSHPLYDSMASASPGSFAPAASMRMRCSSILDLACEMTRRHASKELDKISGLSYLMKCRTLPLYIENEPIKLAWLPLVRNLSGQADSACRSRTSSDDKLYAMTL
ncbi:hypothetical protein BDZ91DRAFT_798401 [Kalaharituber pfeilii]|nr:hypothetical protein BDZ91DRAFT_798401 [Kalaharituber pfeilii]